MFEEADVLLIARRWARRGAHTSVERFLDYFPDAERLTTDDLWQRPDRLLHLMAVAAHQDGYTIWGVELEIRAVLRALRRRRPRPRIVHFLYGDHDYHFSGRFLRRLGVKTVATFFFSIEELERRMPDKGHLAHLDLALATGRAQMEYLARFVDRDRLALLPLGVDTAFFSPGPANRRVPGRLLQVGANRRDLATLAAAFTLLRHELGDLSLHVVGCEAAAAAFAGVEGVIISDRLTDDELLEAYREAEVLVLPLSEGGSSNALNEALATGLPVVATDQPNLADYATPACVRLVPPGDAGAFARACRDLLVDTSARHDAQGAARRHGLTLDWQEVKGQLVGHYERLLDN